VEIIQGFRLLTAYLRWRWRDLLVLLGFMFTFFGVFYLYGLSGEPVGYASLLCAVIGLLYAGWDFYRFVQRWRTLVRLRSQITWSLEHLPTPADLLEQGYQELLAVLFDEAARTRAQVHRARQELEEYYTMWVHQVKTPIAAARLLLQTGAGGEQTPDLEMELFKIERYVEMVLQYLRVESPSADLLIRRSLLDDIVRQAVRRYARWFVQKQIRLEYAELGVEVLTDAKWLTFVIEQILSNALKYTHQGSISIYLDPTAPKTLVIADTGMGIASEDLPRIFEKGYTGHIGRRERHSTGIGLYLCKRIMDRLGHTITVESTVGHGTKVKIGLAEADLTVL
jgi:signal transduction histidine kinase